MKDEISRYLGIDWGLMRIGLAIGDAETKLATPFKTVPDLDALLEAVEAEGIQGIIIGRPVKKDDPSRAVYPAYQAFLEDLKKQSPVPVAEVDERLTSKAADQLGAGGKGRASLDEVAAMLILQSYFDQNLSAEQSTKSQAPNDK
jgi:putative Holliday junction resolvase